MITALVCVSVVAVAAVVLLIRARLTIPDDVREYHAMREFASKLQVELQQARVERDRANESNLELNLRLKGLSQTLYVQEREVKMCLHKTLANFDAIVEHIRRAGTFVGYQLSSSDNGDQSCESQPSSSSSPWPSDPIQSAEYATDLLRRSLDTSTCSS